MYIERTLSKRLISASKAFKVVLLTGPRQVGKTTLLMHLKEKNRGYVTLDDPIALLLAKNEPAAFFDRYPLPILIDEIQRAPELFLEIKRRVDMSSETGQIWLTGSQQFTLMKECSESLAGRVAILRLQGLSQSEKNNEIRDAFTVELHSKRKNIFASKEALFDAIVKGSFPQLVDDATERNLYLSSYIQTYLERDVREITQVSNLLTFSRFMQLIASRTGQVLNYTSIACDIGITVNTAKAWVNILCVSGITELLLPYFSNIGKRLTKTPKLYFLDTGLAAYLSGIQNGEALMNSPLSGAFLETYAISEILKSYWHNGKETTFSFYRDARQKEIDLVIEKDGLAVPIEIKTTSNPTASMAATFKEIPQEKCGKGAVLCTASESYPLEKGLYAIPIGLI